MLGAIGLRPDQLDDCLVTHLDHDHFHAGWIAHGPPHPQARLILSDRHAHAADEFGRLQAPSAVRKRRTAWRTFAFEAPGHGPAAEFVLQPGVRVHPIMLSHDELGVAAFRIELEDVQRGAPGHVMGFATDLGRTTPALVDHFRGVHTLAIESNYCPEMQHSSLRPAGLKDRIMNGSGHLSNQEALAFIAEIEPGEGGGFGPQHVVLLHLSRDCNHPDVVGALHAGSDYALTIASQFAPTRWIRLGHHAGARESRHVVQVRAGARPAGVAATPLLWGA